MATIRQHCRNTTGKVQTPRLPVLLSKANRDACSFSKCCWLLDLIKPIWRWPGLPSQSNRSSQTKHFVPQQPDILKAQLSARESVPPVPELPSHYAQRHRSPQGCSSPETPPCSRHCRARMTHSCQQSSSAAFLQLQLIHQNTHFSVSPPQRPLSVLDLDIAMCCLLADWTSAAETQ